MSFTPFVETFVRKTVDESVTSSAVLQNDNELFISIGSNQTIQFDFILYISGANGGDFKCTLNAPTGSVGRWAFKCLPAGAIDVLDSNLSSLGRLDFDGSQVGIAGTVTGSTYAGTLKGIMVNGATSGILQLQWAQNAVNGNPTTVSANSYLRAIKFT